MSLRFLNSLLDVIFPKKCLACKGRFDELTIDNLICAECWVKIKRNLPPFCHSCGRRLERKSFSKSICPMCLKQRLHFDRAFSPCVYEGVIKELIHEFKYKSKDYLGQTLSRLMIEFVKEYSLPIDWIDFIVPIPLHKTRLREREFNQAQILSKHIATEFKKSVLSDSLRRDRYTRTQTDLETGRRLANVKDCFCVAKGGEVRGKNILLVDDVLTSASTSSEAALALKNAGAGVVFVLTVAN